MLLFLLAIGPGFEPGFVADTTKPAKRPSPPPVPTLERGKPAPRQPAPPPEPKLKRRKPPSLDFRPAV